ncbi:MAG: YonK family protein [Clostridium sp.]|uniref:YonK family protein n=1 Tax=Clostridium sp. TaxID=1506 RepID=UPI003EE69803
MAKKKKTISMKNAEVLFGDEGIKILERLKEEEIETDLETVLREFEGCANISITIATESEI